MDAAGIGVQVLSHNQPGCQALDAAAAVSVAREVNDLLFEAVKAHPRRFAGLAALPTADPAAAAKELERAVTALGLKGAMINGATPAASWMRRNSGASSSVRRLSECRSICIRAGRSRL